MKTEHSQVRTHREGNTQVCCSVISHHREQEQDVTTGLLDCNLLFLLRLEPNVGLTLML